VSAVDVLMMVKGVCEAASSFQHIDPDLVMRQMDLVRAAISTPGAPTSLRGRRPTVEDFERASATAAKAAARRASA
jgi:hypothetical protein